MAYKVIFHYPNGMSYEDEEIFETREEAEEYGLDSCGCAQQGAEILHLSNPGDYPEETEEIDFEVIEVDD